MRDSTNIKNLIAAAYLAGVYDAFNKSKGLDTLSLQKNIDDAFEFRKAILEELKDNKVSNPELILRKAKEKCKDLFCEKYSDELRCKITPPTQEKNTTEPSFTSLVSQPSTNSLNKMSPAPSQASSQVPSPAPSPAQSQPVVNVSALNPMIQTLSPAPKVGGKNK